MATKKKTVVEDINDTIEETTEQEDVQEQVEQNDITHDAILTNQLNTCRKDLFNAINSNNLEWLIEIIDRINNDKTLCKFENIDYFNYFSGCDFVKNKSLLYFYKTFKYIKDREYKIFNLCIFLSEYENDINLYKDCISLLSEVTSKISAIDLNNLIQLAIKFNDPLNKIKLENLLKEINNVK